MVAWVGNRGHPRQHKVACRLPGELPMSTTAVGHCSHCAAVVNRHWPSCLVCHAALPALSLEIGTPASVVPTQAQEATTEAAAPPLRPGWRVVYRDQQWVLCGGCNDRQHGTVAECQWVAGAWTVTLTDGQTMPLSRVRSVGAVDHKGCLLEAWTVKEHGYDGEGPLCNRGKQNAI